MVSNQAATTATLPDGERPVLARMELTLKPDGQFHSEVRLTDVVQGLDFPASVQEGSYTASAGVARLTTTRAWFRADGAAPQGNVVLQPTGPGTSEFRYAVTGGQMTFGYVCPANANCIPARFTLFTLAEGEG